MTDDQLSRLGVELVLAMMASATTERISPVDWWPRAKSALLAAVARGKTWGEIVTTMAAKLQIETLRLESGRAICSMAIGTADLLAFRRVAQAEAVYLVAEAAAIREHDRAAEAARREAGR
jgi:hypothetical protein